MLMFNFGLVNSVWVHSRGEAEAEDDE
jgi:hypothetical protein